MDLALVAHFELWDRSGRLFVLSNGMLEQLCQPLTLKLLRNGSSKSGQWVWSCSYPDSLVSLDYVTLFVSGYMHGQYDMTWHHYMHTPRALQIHLIWLAAHHTGHNMPRARCQIRAYFCICLDCPSTASKEPRPSLVPPKIKENTCVKADCVQLVRVIATQDVGFFIG